LALTNDFIVGGIVGYLAFFCQCIWYFELESVANNLQVVVHNSWIDCLMDGLC